MRYKIIDTLIDIRLNPDLEQICHPFLTEDLSEKIKIDLSMYPQPCYGMDVLNTRICHMRFGMNPGSYLPTAIGHMAECMRVKPMR